MQVLFLERSTPLLTVKFVLRRGATSDPAGKKGLMAMTARMLVEETRSKGSLALAEAAESLGGELDAQTGYDHTSVSLEFLRDDMAIGFDLLAEVVTAPRFDPKVFARVRHEWLDGLRAQRQEPSALANIAGMRALLGNQLGAPTDGSISDVSKLSSVDLAGAHERLYDPSNSALVVVGGAGFDAVLAQARRAFAKWRSPEKKAPTFSASDHPAKAQAMIVDRPGAVQSAIFVGLRLPARRAEGFERRELLNQVLGGMFTSRLNQNLREKNAFTYGAFSHSYATSQFGVWELNTSVRAEDTAPALGEILAELHAIRSSKPVNEEELARGKRELLGRYTAHLERSSEINDDISELFVDELKLDYLARLAGVIDEIGVADVQREAESSMKADGLTVVIVGEAKSLRTPIEAVLSNVSMAPPLLVD
jgi:zinc protease